MFPIFPLLCIAVLVAGTGGLAWYESLPDEEKERADELACEYAWDLFGKGLKELSAEQARQVHQLTRRHFG